MKYIKLDIQDRNTPLKGTLSKGNEGTNIGLIIDFRCDDENKTFELGQHLGIIA
jgi:hypothetical protein